MRRACRGAVPRVGDPHERVGAVGRAVAVQARDDHGVLVARRRDDTDPERAVAREQTPEPVDRVRLGWLDEEAPRRRHIRLAGGVEPLLRGASRPLGDGVGTD